MDPSPKSLVLDLLSTVGRATAPVRALVEAAALFGIGDNRLRVALARLGASGLVESDGRGRYRLGPAARGVSDEIRGWRQLEERLCAWSGGWVAVHTASLAPAGGAAARRNRERALALLGFRPFAPGLALRPDNLAGGVADLRSRLGALGLAGEGLVFGIAALDAEAEARARTLWNGPACIAGYRAGVAALERSAARLPGLPREAAMVEAFRVGGAALRQLVLDPLLPEPIVPAAERRALVAAMRRYDALGRRAWAGWLGEADPHDLGVPLGVREARPAEASGLGA